MMIIPFAPVIMRAPRSHKYDLVRDIASLAVDVVYGSCLLAFAIAALSV